MQNQEGIDLRGILSVVFRWSWLIVACTLLTVITAYIFTSRMAPVYQASLTLLVNPIRNSGGSVSSDYTAGQQLTPLYSQMLTGDSVLGPVISELGLSETPATLASRISATQVNGMQMIRLTVSSPSPSEAAQIANKLAEVFTAQVRTQNAQRYASSLQDIQAKMNSLSASIADTQSQINTLNTTKSSQDAELDRLNFQLSKLSDDYRSLQQNYQSVQLTITELTDKIRVFEKSRVIDPVDHPNTSTATLLFDQSLVSSGDNISTDSAVQLFVNTYGSMVKSDAVLQTTIDRLSLTENVSSLADKIWLAPVPNTQLIKLSVTDTEPSISTIIADTITETFINQVQTLLAAPYQKRLDSIQGQMEQVSVSIDQTQADINALKEKRIQTVTRLDQLNGQLVKDQNDYHTQEQNYGNLQLTIVGMTETVSIAEPAQAPVSPVSNRSKYLLYALVVGCVAGAGCAFLLEQVQDKIRTREDVTNALRLTTIGTIGQMDKDEANYTIDKLKNHPIDNDFRKLSASIRLSHLDKPIKTLLITSPSASEGKSMAVANLAIAMVNTGFRVIALDADMRVPHLHQLFNLECERGLTDALLDGNPAKFLKPTRVDGLAVMTCGSIAPNPAEILSSPKFAALLKELSQQADFVIIDSPPVLASADATILASVTDGVALVLRAGSTSRKAAKETVEDLEQVKANLVGVVLNYVTSRSEGYYRYYRKGDKKPGDRKVSKGEKLVTTSAKGQRSAS